MIRTKASIIVKDKAGRDEYGSRITRETTLSGVTGYYTINQKEHELDNGSISIKRYVKFIAAEVLTLPKECYLVIDDIHYLVTNHKALYKKGTLIEAIQNG